MEVRRELCDATRDDCVVQVDTCLNVKRHFECIEVKSKMKLRHGWRMHKLCSLSGSVVERSRWSGLLNTFLDMCDLD